MFSATEYGLGGRPGWSSPAITTDPAAVPLLRSQLEASIRRMQSIDASMKACITQKMRGLGDREFQRLALRLKATLACCGRSGSDASCR